MKKILLLLSIINFGIVQAQIVNIPDPILKDFLINHNPIIDTNGDGEIQINEAINYSGGLTYYKNPLDTDCILECDDLFGADNPDIYDCYQNCHTIDLSYFIHDLTGIEQFINVPLLGFDNIIMDANPIALTNLNNLEELTISLYSNIGNYEANIDISNNINLQKVIINQIESKDEITLSDINLDNLTNLEWLSIGSNMGLEFIDLSTNTNLTRFNCSNNELTTINLNNNVNLEYLDIYFNNLNNINLENNSNLLSLACSGNNFENLNLSNNLSLVFLTCSYNNITFLDLNNNVNLVGLSCNNNQLLTLDLNNQNIFRELKCSNNVNLTYINLKNGNNENFFLNFKSDFENLPNLETVCLDNINSELANFILDEVNHEINFVNNCTLSINENEIFSFSVYPIPMVNILNIKSKTEIVKLEIYSKLGQKIKETKENKVDISNLTRGLYFVKVVDVNGNFGVKKIVKK